MREDFLYSKCVSLSKLYFANSRHNSDANVTEETGLVLQTLLVNSVEHRTNKMSHSQP